MIYFRENVICVILIDFMATEHCINGEYHADLHGQHWAAVMGKLIGKSPTAFSFNNAMQSLTNKKKVTKSV